jgi:hypothetical protein
MPKVRCPTSGRASSRFSENQNKYGRNLVENWAECWSDAEYGDGNGVGRGGVSCEGSK